jgi:hypothetical protein
LEQAVSSHGLPRGVACSTSVLSGVLFSRLANACCVYFAAGDLPRDSAEYDGAVTKLGVLLGVDFNGVRALTPVQISSSCM